MLTVNAGGDGNIISFKLGTRPPFKRSGRAAPLRLNHKQQVSHGPHREYILARRLRDHR